MDDHHFGYKHKFLKNHFLGVSHYGIAIYIFKNYVKAKERIMEIQIFHHAKIYLIFKKSSKRNQNLYNNYIRTL
jgi:hypothetical protein